MAAPFAGARRVLAVLPDIPVDGDPRERRRLADLPALFAHAATALSRELGAPVVISTDPGEHSADPRWLIGPWGCSAAVRAVLPASKEPRTFLDRRRKLLISDGPDFDAVLETFGQLRTLGRLADGLHPVRSCRDAADVATVIATEVADCWPSFQLRGIDWAALVRDWAPKVRSSPKPLEVAERWLACLGDAHTTVRPTGPVGRPDLEVRVEADGAIRLAWVPDYGPAHAAGVRVGQRLIGPDGLAMRARTGASPHHRPWVTGRRLLEGEPGTPIDLVAMGPDGRSIRWTETRRSHDEGDGVFLTAPAIGGKPIPVLQIRRWLLADEGAIDAAMSQVAKMPHLIVDLRGNGGGNMAVAMRFRDRFLRARTRLGTLRHTAPGGGLGPEEELWGEPSTTPFAGTVAFLTDPLTYSASEDALLGLQGLPHVRVVGEPSGGGSGRVRRVRLLPGSALQVSQALTWDRTRRCVEGSGIPVDHVIPARDPRILEVAARR